MERCEKCQTVLARTRDPGKRICMYCHTTVELPDPSKYIKFPEYIYTEPWHREHGDFYAGILDFLHRFMPYAEPTLDIGGYDGPYQSFFPGEYDIYDGDKGQVIDGHLYRPSDYYNTVVSTETLEHIDDPINMFGEITRVLKSKGRILITTPVAWAVHPSPKDYWRLQPNGLEYLCQRFHVDIIAQEYIFVHDACITGLFLGQKQD